MNFTRYLQEQLSLRGVQRKKEGTIWATARHRRLVGDSILRWFTFISFYYRPGTGSLNKIGAQAYGLGLMAELCSPMYMFFEGTGRQD